MLTEVLTLAALALRTSAKCSAFKDHAAFATGQTTLRVSDAFTCTTQHSSYGICPSYAVGNGTQGCFVRGIGMYTTPLGSVTSPANLFSADQHSVFDTVSTSLVAQAVQLRDGQDSDARIWRSLSMCFGATSDRESASLCVDEGATGVLLWSPIRFCYGGKIEDCESGPVKNGTDIRICGCEDYTGDMCAESLSGRGPYISGAFEWVLVDEKNIPNLKNLLDQSNTTCNNMKPPSLDKTSDKYHSCERKQNEQKQRIANENTGSTLRTCSSTAIGFLLVVIVSFASYSWNF